MARSERAASVVRNDTQPSLSSDSEQELSITAAHNDHETVSGIGVTTRVAPIMQPDLDIDDEGFEETTSSTYLSSIASEVSRGILENERIYPGYGKYSYGMPIDEDEMDRMDLQHHKFKLILGGKHFLAPIGNNPMRILDLGTGTGMWALDVADAYPSAQVIGIDIAPIQPIWVASNCQFEIDDMEEPWTWEKNSFDFIHLREPVLMIRDWSTLLQEVYDHLAPGGYCELASCYPLPMCDDGTMPEDSGFLQTCKKFVEASKVFGTPSDIGTEFKTLLQNAGFVDVTENIFKVPSSPWPKDKRLKQIGAMEMANLVNGAAAYGLRAFQTAFNWTREEIEVRLMEFRRDVKNRHYHQYCQ